jgi:hypothetical protein
LVSTSPFVVVEGSNDRYLPGRGEDHNEFTSPEPVNSVKPEVGGMNLRTRPQVHGEGQRRTLKARYEYENVTYTLNVGDDCWVRFRKVTSAFK